MTRKVKKAKNILIGVLAIIVMGIMTTASLASGSSSKAFSGNPGSVLLNAKHGDSPEVAGKKKHQDKSGQGVKKSDKDRDKDKSKNGNDKKKPARHQKHKKHHKHHKHHGSKGK